MIEERKAVNVYNVYAKCDNNCDGTYIPHQDYIVWDDNGTKNDLSDDTFMYRYICDKCSNVIISDKKYPYQEFVEV